MAPDRGSWSGRRVCVTGGTGFLGFHIIRALLGAGARVRVLALEPHANHPIRTFAGVEPVYGDVRDGDLVRRALDGCTVVFHTAGIVADWGPALRAMFEVHHEGTRNVLKHAPKGARIVHTSSIVTIGASHAGEPLTEESPFNLAQLAVDYVQAKRLSERLALDSGRDVVIVNPGYLVGPEDYERSVMGRFCKRYWRGQVPIAPPGGFNLVDVRDVALGHLLAAERGQSGRRYILGGENRTFPEFMALMAQVAGFRPRAAPAATWWSLAALARLTEARSAFTKKQPYPSFQNVRLNRYYWFYRSRRAEHELGYRARPLEESLADTYRWCQETADLTVRGPSCWWMRVPRAPRVEAA